MASASGPAGRLGEFGRIDSIFRPLAVGFPGAAELTDDCGYIACPPGEELVITTDAIVEGVHFLPGEDPHRLARKLLRVNLSDLAAKGARPVAYTLVMALQYSVGDDWVARLAEGLAMDQKAFGISLLGGDSTGTTGPATLVIGAFGTIRAGSAPLRSRARLGDVVVVSGTLGDGVLGLMAAKGELDWLPDGDRQALEARYHLPEPRLELGAAIAPLVNAMMDVSDGIGGDLAKICGPSRVGAVVELARLPLSSAAASVLAARPDLATRIWSGGDDYELLATLPADRLDAATAAAISTGVPLTAIGRIVDEGGGADEPVAWIGPDGRPLSGLVGWAHEQGTAGHSRGARNPA